MASKRRKTKRGSQAVSARRTRLLSRKPLVARQNQRRFTFAPVMGKLPYSGPPAAGPVLIRSRRQREVVTPSERRILRAAIPRPIRTLCRIRRDDKRNAILKTGFGGINGQRRYRRSVC